jgi:segregation and condensation protein B
VIVEVKERLVPILEALLLAADQPLSVEQLFRMFMAEGGVTKKDVKAALDLLGQQLAGRAVELREVASGYRLQVRADYAEWVGKLWQERPPRFSRALLETLALVCYRQPITRGEIEEIRGVSLSPNIIKTLIERGWVREVGVKEVPGRPALLGTTPQFLDDFNLKSLDELPSLPEIKDPAQLEAALLRLGASAPPDAQPPEAKPDEADEQPATVH